MLPGVFSESMNLRPEGRRRLLSPIQEICSSTGTEQTALGLGIVSTCLQRSGMTAHQHHPLSLVETMLYSMLKISSFSLWFLNQPQFLRCEQGVIVLLEVVFSWYLQRKLMPWPGELNVGTMIRDVFVVCLGFVSSSLKGNVVTWIFE